MTRSDDLGWWKANAYVIHTNLDLFNNFTWFTRDPINGDQFHQHDDRIVTGANGSRTFEGTFGGFRTETTFGLQSRYDSINLGLSFTKNRQFVTDGTLPGGVVLDDKVKQGSGRNLRPEHDLLDRMVQDDGWLAW
jgi:hypothetical protein